ncbi:MAG: ABC transporter ATP-binding protein [Pseudomonadota bacterium]
MVKKISSIIETGNLGKKYPVPKGYRELLFHPFVKKEKTALENVSIRVQKGEIFGLLGPNGSGKTTLLKILSTLILPSSGHAAINGLDVVRHEKKIKAITGVVVSDERSFYWRLTGRENLSFFATLNNIPRAEAQRRIQEIASLLGFEDRIHHRFQEYSSGTRQKMAIARGLLTDPEILFMDEPTRSLDPAVSATLRNFIRDVLVRRSNKTIFLATNNMKEAEDICDRFAIIHNGIIRHSGTILEIRNLFQANRRFEIRVAGDMEEIQRKIGRSLFSENLIHVQNDHPFDQSVRITLEMESGKQDIASFIEWLVQSNIKVQSCIHRQIPLDELFMRSIHA